MEVIKCSCGHTLSRVEELYFYEQDLGAWHLIVKPQLMKEADRGTKFTLSPFQSLRAGAAYTPNSMLCAGCNRVVGKESLVGPQKEGYFCFDANALRDLPIAGFTRKKKLMWKTIKSSMPYIESWNFQVGLPIVADAQRQPFIAPQEDDLRHLDVSQLTGTKPRNYQVELFVRAALANSIIVLPTGAGKTLVAVMMAKFLKMLNRGKAVIFLADRIPLVHQQAKVLMDEGGLTVRVLTGENISDDITHQKAMADCCAENDVVALTAKCFSTILDKNWLQISECCLIIFDEAHHARGNHPFSMVMETLKRCPLECRPRILGLTASPGGNSSISKTAHQINELCSSYSQCQILAPALYPEEMKNIINEADIDCEYVNLTPAEVKLQAQLWQHFRSLWNLLRQEFDKETAGYILPCEQHLKRVTNQSLLNLLKDLRGLAAKATQKNSVQFVEYSMFVLCLLDEADVHGVVAIKERLSRAFSNVSRLLTVPDVADLREISCDDRKTGTSSSRVKALIKAVRSVIASNQNSRILVFVRTRAKARRLVSVLDEDPGIAILRPSQLVGHSGFDGMSWTEEQKPMLDRFRSGIVKLLISTSVLEEGLDVPSCNAVIRFDGMGSMTGIVQSRGRARHKDGQFIVLMTEEERNTFRDIRLQEKNMLIVVKECQESLSQSTQSIIRHITETLQKSHQSTLRPAKTKGAEEEHNQAERLHERAYVIKLRFHSEWLNEALLQATISDFAEVWKCDMVHSLVYLCAPVGQDSLASYQSICVNVLPLLQDGDNHHLWIHKCSPDTPEVQSRSWNLHFQSIALGYFRDPSTYVQVSNLVGGSFLIDQHTTNSADPCGITGVIGSDVLSLAVPGQVTIAFPVEAINECVVIHHDERSRRLYIPLRQAPFVHKVDGGKPCRMGADPIAASAATVHGCGSVQKLVNQIGKFFVYQIDFTATDDGLEKDHHELVMYLEKHGILVFDSRILREESDIVNNLTPNFCPDLGYSTLYLMECIFSQYGSFISREPALKLAQMLLTFCTSESQRESALLSITGQICWFSDLVALLKQAVERNACSEETPTTLWIPRNYVMVRSATVTPSRAIFYEPLPMKSSRMLRHFNPAYFLKVSFRDENYDVLPGTEQFLLERVRRTLKSGLLVAGQTFVYLGGTLPMFREHCCWLTCLDPKVVREWLGDFSTVIPRCVASYVASVGLGMSSSDMTIRVDEAVIKNLVDDNTEDGMHSFSEGVGKISPECLSDVLGSMGKSDEVTSAIQVCVAGHKGVLVLDREHQTECERKGCVLSKRMFKFDSQQRLELEVLDIASSHPAYLDRRAIVLLSSLGVQDSTFEKLQEKQLEGLLSIFEAPSRDKIIQYSSELPLKKIGVNIDYEPFLQSMLAAVYSQKVTALLDKSHIFLSGGRRLTAIVDDTSTLKPEEIFVQLRDASTHWESEIISGPCVMFKNPCMHPGDDIRKLCAKDVPHLRHLVNCVVLSRGYRPNPYGAILDKGGDQYTVIWMPDLIPERDVGPMSDDTCSITEVQDISESKEISFFISAINNVQLDKLASAHLALADSRETGALDEGCIALAKWHADALNFLKTGSPVYDSENVAPPTDCKLMKEHSKVSEPSYSSQKVLGKLYERAKGLLPNVHHHRSSNLSVTPDNSFLVRGHEKFSRQAQETYRYYRSSLEILKRCYGVQQEAEIITGCIVSMYDRLSPDCAELTQIIGQQYKQLVQRFRGIFREQTRDPVSKEERYQLASAWYYAAYTDKDLQRRCLSFPWVIADELTRVVNLSRAPDPTFSSSSTQCNHDDPGNLQIDNGGVTAGPEPSLGEALTDSMLLDFYERQPMLFASLLEREDLREKIQICIKAGLEDVTIEIFGSSSMFLFEPAMSDVDLCVLFEHKSCVKKCSPTPTSLQKEIQVLNDVLPILKNDFPGISLVEKTRVPILKHEGALPFDLTANSSGVKKRGIILSYINCYPALLLLLMVLVRWARYMGLTAKSRSQQISVFGLLWLVIQFCLEHRYISEVAVDDDYTRGRPSNLLISVIEELMNMTPNSKKRFDRDILPGDVLLMFFRKMADTNIVRIPGSPDESPFSIRDPLKGDGNCVDMSVDFKYNFQNACLQAWHALASTRTIKSLFSIGERRVRLLLSRFQSSLFQGSELYYAERFQSESGGKSKVRMLYSKADRGVQPAPRYLEIHGTSVEIASIQRQLQELNPGQCWMPRTASSRFVKGAAFLLFEGSLREEDSVGFLRYSGPRHLKHTSGDVHTPVLVAPVGGSDWRTHALAKLRVSVWRQRQLLLHWSHIGSPAHDDNHWCTGKLRAILRFGTFYIINIPSVLEVSMDKVSVSALEEVLSRGRRHAEPWKRGAETVAALQDDSGDLGEDEDDEVSSLPTMLQNLSTKMNIKQKPRKRNARASQSLYPQVKISIDHLRHILERKGFAKAEQLPPVYNVKVFSTKDDSMIRLNEKLEFVSLAKKSARWLAGSLIVRVNEGSSYRSTADGASAPNCMRFVVEIESKLETEGELLAKAQLNRILDFDKEGRLSVGEAFQGDVAIVRKVSKETWRNDSVGLAVLIMDVHKWEGWDRKRRKFKREQSAHCEIDLHLRNADKGLRGSSIECDNFIHTFWKAAMEFKDVFYDADNGLDFI